MNFLTQLVHTLRHIFRCEGKFDSAKGSNSKWPPFHTIEWWTVIGFGNEMTILYLYRVAGYFGDTFDLVLSQ